MFGRISTAQLQCSSFYLFLICNILSDGRRSVHLGGLPDPSHCCRNQHINNYLVFIVLSLGFFVSCVRLCIPVLSNTAYWLINNLRTADCLIIYLYVLSVLIAITMAPCSSLRYTLRCVGNLSSDALTDILAPMFYKLSECFMCSLPRL